MELEFPTIETEAASTAVAVRPDKEQQLDLTKISLTAVALAMYGPWRQKVDEAKKNLSTLALDLSTASKCAEARSLRKRVVLDPLAEARKTSAGIKSTMAQTSKAVGAELERIEAAWEKEVDPLILPQIEAREAVLAEERRKAEELERVRKEGHRTRIEAIRIYIDRASAPGMTADRVARGIAQLEAIPTPTKEQWEEFAVQAADVLCQTLDKMRALHAKLLADEKAKAEADRVAKENEELRARLAEIEAAKPAPAPAPAPADPINAASAATRGAAVEASSAVLAAPFATNAQGSGSLAGTPAACASTDAKAATASANGCEGQGAHAEERASQPDTRPDLNVGAINSRLGFTLTREFIVNELRVPGFEGPKKHTNWAASQWPDIVDALIVRLSELRNL